MGRHETAIVEGHGAVDPVEQSRSTYIRYNEERDLPMLLAIRNASFISHGQMFDQLVAKGSEASRRAFNWRIQRLVKAGVVMKMPPQLPYCGPVYAITRSGLACLEACGQGLMSLTSESRSLVNPAQILHYLELGEIQAAFQRTRLLREWTGDLEVRSINQSIDLPLAKDYDAIAELELRGSRYRIALEYERSLKSSARYREVVAAIEDESQIQLLVYFTSSIDLLYQLKAEFEDQRFPIVLATSRSFCMSPLATRLYSTHSLGGNRTTLEYILEAIPTRQRAIAVE
jgi:hypothetical protein